MAELSSINPMRMKMALPVQIVVNFNCHGVAKLIGGSTIAWGLPRYVGPLPLCGHRVRWRLTWIFMRFTFSKHLKRKVDLATYWGRRHAIVTPLLKVFQTHNVFKKILIIFILQCTPQFLIYYLLEVNL